MTASPKPNQRLTLLSAIPTLEQLANALELARKEFDLAVQQPWLIDDKASYCISVCAPQGGDPEWTFSSGLAHSATIHWTYNTGDVGLICNLLQAELTGVPQDTEHVPNSYANLSSISWGDFGEGDPGSGSQAGGSKVQPAQAINPAPANLVAPVTNPAPAAPSQPATPAQSSPVQPQNAAPTSVLGAAAASAAPQPAQSPAASLFGQLPSQPGAPVAAFGSPPAAPENPFAMPSPPVPPNPFASPAPPPQAPPNPFGAPPAAVPESPFASAGSPPGAPPNPFAPPNSFANAPMPPSPAASLFGLPQGQAEADPSVQGQAPASPTAPAENQSQSAQAMNAFAAAQAAAPPNPFAQPQAAPSVPPNPFAPMSSPPAPAAPPVPPANPFASPQPFAQASPAHSQPGGSLPVAQKADPFAEASDPIAQVANALAQAAAPAFQSSNPFAQALNLPPASVTETQKQTVDLAEQPKAQPFQPTNPFAQSLLSLGELTNDSLKETAQLNQAALPSQPAQPASSNPFAQTLTAPSPQMFEAQKTTVDMNETPAARAQKDASTAPTEHPFAQRAPSAPQNNPFMSAQSNASASTFGGAAPLPQAANPFAQAGQSQQSSDNPFANALDPFAQTPNPFVPAQVTATQTPTTENKDSSSIKSVKEGPFSGTIKENGFSELLHSIALSKSTGRLAVEDRALTAELFFEDGMPVHASAVETKGDSAILELMTWTAGQYQFNPQEKSAEKTVRNSLELLIDQGMKLTDRYRELTKAGLKAESYLYRTNPALTEGEFEEHVDKTMALNMNQQKWFYQQIDDRSTLFDILRRHSMPRSQWVPLLLSLVRGTLVEISDKQVAPGGNLESVGIDKSLVGVAAKSLTNPDTGLVTYPMFLFLLEQEYARFDRNGLPLCTIIFDVAIRQPNGIVPIPNADVIRQLGNSWKELVRSFDVVAHYQTSQYAMLLPYTDCANAIVVANRVVATLAEVKVEGMERSSFLVACGIAGIPEDCRDPGHLLSASMEALKISKQKGSPVVAYSSLYV